MLAGGDPAPGPPMGTDADGFRSRPAGAAAVRLHHHFPHHFPELHDRPVGLYRDAARDVAGGPDRTASCGSPSSGPRFSRCRSRMGVVSGIVLSYQLGTNWSRFSRRRRQHHRPAARLRGADRVFPGGDASSASCCSAATACRAGCMCCRRSSSRSAPRCRRSGFSPPIAGCRRRPATRCATASPIPVDWWAIVFNPSFPYRFAHMLNAAYLTTGFVVLAVGARYLLAGDHVDEGAHHAAHGDRPAGDPGAAATLHRRPARAQHAQASADQGRRDGGALGRQQARRLPHLRLAGREGREEPFRDVDPARLVADPHPRSERAVSRASRRAAAGPSAGASRCSSPSASCSASASS